MFRFSRFLVADMISPNHLLTFLDGMFFSLILIDTLARTEFEIDRSSLEAED